MLNSTNTAATMIAQKTGRSHSGTSPSCGIGVTPYTSPTSSSSGLGLVIRLTATVTMTHTTHDHSARYMFSAMSRAFGESATYRSAAGLTLTHAHIPIDDNVPARSPQNPPCGDVR